MLYRRHTTVVDWMLAVRGPGFRNESIIKRRQRDYCGFSENYRPRVGKHFRGGFFDRYLECQDNVAEIFRTAVARSIQDANQIHVLFEGEKQR